MQRVKRNAIALAPIMFEAVNDLIDEFSSNQEKYINHSLRQKLDEAVNEYIAAA